MNLRSPFRFNLYRHYNLLKKQKLKTCCSQLNKTNFTDKDEEKTTHFGFKTVKESDKTKEGKYLN